MKPDNVSPYFQQLQQKNPPELLKDRGGYRLEGRVRAEFDAKYSQRPSTIVVEAMLAELPGKVSSEAERLFLTEALACFRAKAFRAAIVMTWNLAYDHFQEWIVQNHLGAFNARISAVFQKKNGVTIVTKQDFTNYFKESEVIDIAKSAGFLHDNMKKILIEKLAKRNMAAHPSLVDITQFQAADVISDLVNNIILKLH